MLLPLALLLALGAGLGVAYLGWHARPSVHDLKTLRAVSGLPVLGAVTRVTQPQSLARERRHAWELAAMFAALPAFYLVGLIALELLYTRGA